MAYRTELTPRQTWTPGFRGFESRRLLNQAEPVAAANSGRLLDHNPGIAPLKR